jgi:hypothetical protein
MDNPLYARSSPPAQPDEAPRQLPFLPTEVLQRIIQLSLPRLSFRDVQGALQRPLEALRRQQALSGAGAEGARKARRLLDYRPHEAVPVCTSYARGGTGRQSVTVVGSGRRVRLARGGRDAEGQQWPYRSLPLFRAD